MEAYIGGVSTRKVDALGAHSGISKSQVQAFLNRPLQETGYAYVSLDATYLHGLLGLKERGLTGVKLVVSDAHAGLTKAIRRQL